MDGATEVEPNTPPPPRREAKKGQRGGQIIRQKGKRGAKGRRAEMADQSTADLSAENGDSQTQSVTSEVQEKEVKSN